MDVLVGRVFGQRLIEIQEVLVEVHIALGGVLHMGHAVAVDGVNYQHSDVLRNIAVMPFGDPGGLATAAGQTLDAVHAGGQNQQIACIRRAEKRQINGQGSAAGAGGRVLVGLGRDARQRAGGTKFIPCFGVVG